MKLLEQYLLLLISFLLLSTNGLGNKKDSTLILNFNEKEITIRLIYPETSNPKGNIVLLHGYNLPADDWCNKTTFCKKALAAGFIIIQPEFGKTTYHAEVFPETQPRYLTCPTRKWIVDSAITFIQNKTQLLLENQNNFIAGISTGARGATLIAMDLPQLFKGCASLSGDFDQSKLSTDAIYIGYYGLYSRFKERWANVDNIYNSIEKLQTPIYLAHGKKDVTCPVSQTIVFYQRLIEVNPTLKVVYAIDENGEHNYAFWEKQSDPLLKFFISLCQ